MPRKLLYDSQRGWYGWEGHFNSVLRMSVAAMFATNVKNERERFLHRKAVIQILTDQRDSENSMDREMRKIRRELTDMTAYREVYRQNSFVKWEERKRGCISKRNQTKPEEMPITRPDTDRPPVRLPVLARPVTTIDNTVVNSEKELLDGMSTGDNSITSTTTSSKRHGSTRGMLLWRLLRPGVDGNSEKPSSSKTRFAAIVEQEVARAKMLPAQTPAETKNKKNKIKHSVNVRKLKLRERQHERVSSLLPEGCKGVFFLRRYIDKETERFLQESSPSNIRRKRAEQLVNSVRAPGFIDSRRTTSAIMREFEVYKTAKLPIRRGKIFAAEEMPACTK